MSASAVQFPRGSPQRILIVRLSALGDVVLSSGLIPALRQRWPQASVSWLAEAPAAPLLNHNPRLAELLILPKARWKQLWREGRRWQVLREALAWRREMQARRFDLVVDPQGLLKSGLCAWMTGAGTRVSLQPREGNQFFMTRTVQPAAEADRSIAFEYRALAEALGADGFRLDLAVGDEPRAQARQRLAEAGVPARYVVLAAFTTRPQKHWVDTHWAALAEGLLQHGLQPVLLGGPGDAEAANRLAALSPGLINLSGALRLDESVAAIADATLLVGVDTGLTHMGFALGVPTVALFGSTAPYRHGGGAPGLVLNDDWPCAPCHRNPTCAGRFDCMRGLDAPRVLARALALLPT